MKYCQRVTELVSQAQESELSLLEKSAVNIHLFLCPSCRRFERNCQVLRKMMHQFTQAEQAKK